MHIGDSVQLPLNIYMGRDHSQRVQPLREGRAG